MDFATICRLRLGTKKLIVPRPVLSIDGSPNIHGTITQSCELRIRQGTKEVKQIFYITNLGKDRFILGYPWFRAFTPDIDWANNKLRGPKVGIETTHLATAERVKNWIDKKRQTMSMAKAECKPLIGVTAPEMECGRAEVKRTTAAEKFQQNLGVRLQRYKKTKCAKENKRTTATDILTQIKRTHMAADMAHKYVEEHGTNKVVLPEESNQFPPSRGEADHKIILLDTAPTKFNCKVYPMSQREQEIEDNFLD